MTVHTSRIPGAPVSPIEVKLAARSPRPARDLSDLLAHAPTPFFFGAARRSGTTWVASMLNAHPQIECRNEGWLFNDLGCSFHQWIDERRVRAWAARHEARGTWLRDQSIEAVLRTMRRSMWLALTSRAVAIEAWKDPAGLRYLGDKTTSHFCTHVEEIHRTFPDARFLHMLRDGRDVVVSDAFLLFREIDQRDLPADALHEATVAREHFLVHRGKGTPVPLIGPAMMRVLAGDWARCIVGARRARELFGEQFHEVRYERIVADPSAELSAILHWLGVDADPALVDRIAGTHTFEHLSGGRAPGQEDAAHEWRKGIVGDWRTHFTNENKAQFKAIAGELLIELGYEQGMEW